MTPPADLRFDYAALPSRVVFGAGRSGEVAAELERMGIERALVVSTPEQAPLAARLVQPAGSRVAAIYPGAVMHTPVDATERALLEAQQVRADGIVAVGGGSSVGLSKAIAYRTDLPQLVVPTTYAGSEMTPILGQTEHGEKTTLRSVRVQPESVIYDPALTVSLPAAVSGPSAMNAVAHAVEALYAQDRNPITSLMAQEAIRAIGGSIDRVIADGADLGARSQALYGAWLAGTCLGAVGMAIHHKICHTLGGAFDLPHADIHCLMIPYAAAYNREAAPEAMAAICRALDADDAPTALHALMRRVGRVRRLADFGLTPADLERAADLAVTAPYFNPRPVTRDGVLAMLRQAYDGAPPTGA